MTEVIVTLTARDRNELTLMIAKEISDSERLAMLHAQMKSEKLVTILEEKIEYLRSLLQKLHA